MKESEAIKWIKELRDSEEIREFYYVENFIKACDRAIQALEKQIPYKPREYEDKYYSCKCGNVLLYKWKKYPRELTDKKMGLPYCLNCWQKIDWSDTV